jgi:hypothetical protein
LNAGRLALAGLLVLGAAVVPAAGSPGDALVRAEVSELLQTSARPATLTIPVVQGGTSDLETLDLDVLSNLAGGYTVTIRRTALSRGDLTVGLAGVPPANPALVLDLPTAWTTLAAGLERAFGHRTGTISALGGDHWRARIRVGPIGCAETGIHAGVLAFTTRAGRRSEVAPIALVASVRRNRPLCG